MVHSLFVINNEISLKKGYNISQNYNKIMTTNDNLNISFYYIDAVKFYNLVNSIFKFSLINDSGIEYNIFQIGENYDSSNDKNELLDLINRVYSNIENIINVFNTKYIDIITVINSLSILLSNY